MLACIDGLIAMVVTCLPEMGKKGGHYQRIYGDKYGSMLTFAIRHLRGIVDGFVEYLVPE